MSQMVTCVFEHVHVCEKVLASLSPNGGVAIQLPLIFLQCVDQELQKPKSLHGLQLQVAVLFCAKHAHRHLADAGCLAAVRFVPSLQGCAQDSERGLNLLTF